MVEVYGLTEFAYRRRGNLQVEWNGTKCFRRWGTRHCFGGRMKSGRSAITIYIRSQITRSQRQIDVDDTWIEMIPP